MRSTFARHLTIGILGLLLAPVVATAGDSNLDPTFGSFGIVTTAVGYPNDIATAAALQPDGKIVVAGVSQNAATPGDVAVVRYLPDGSLDPTFGTGGSVVTDLGDLDQASAVAIQPDGKIVIAGDTTDPSLTIQFLLARYLPNGSPDGAFGVGGVVTTPIGGVRAQATSLVIDPDGRIVATGSAVFGGDYKIVVARYEDDGDLDATFGTGGVVVTDVAGEGISNAIVRQGDGKLVVAGTRYTNSLFNSADVVLVRYDDSGNLDGAFGTGGIVTHDIGPGVDDASGLVLQPDGKLVVTGTHYVGDQSTNSATALYRFLPSGSPDGTFGIAGNVVTDLTPGDESGEALTLLPDGRFVVVGESGALPIFSDTFDWLVLRYNSNGTLDSTFGTGGHLTLPIGSSNDFTHDVLRQADGKIVVVGSGFNVLGSPGMMALARFGGDCGNGTIDAGEQCDDGNATNDDCCSRGCQGEMAGNACVGNTNLCKANQCDGTGHCGRVLAATGCKLPTAPLKSQLQFKDKTPDKADMAVWKWTKGAAVPLGAFGDPLTTDSYALCVYGGASLLFQADAPAGGTCHGKACWQPIPTKGFKYKDRDTTPNGISSILLKGGVGKRSALVKGKGMNLDLPLLPLPLPVRVQLRSTNGSCWEASFSAFGVKLNDGFQFKGKSD